jgi:hypothetical protein
MSIRSGIECFGATGDRETMEWSAPGRNRRALAGIFLAMMIAGICVAGAQQPQTAAASAPISFKIPAQPLASALQAYGQKAGVQILYESSSAAGQTSAAVEGSFSREDALQRLLAGTGLEVHYTGPHALILALPSAAASDQPPPSPFATPDLVLGELHVRASNEGEDADQFHDYADSIRSDVQKALQHNARTRGGDYRATLDLWIDPSRMIKRTALLRSTGDQDRDAAVAAALRGLAISRPTPANLPQPVRVVITVRSPQ